PSASSGSANAGTFAPGGRRRYQRDGCGASIGKPASPNNGRSAGRNASRSSSSMPSAAPMASSRAPLMSGRTYEGSARSQPAPAASPASICRASAAIGQWSGVRRKWRRSWARRPSPPPADRSARPSARASASPTRWPPRRVPAGSRKVAVAMSAEVADFDDLELARAARRLDRHLVALVLADQRARDRGGNRDQALLDVDRKSVVE